MPKFYWSAIMAVLSVLLLPNAANAQSKEICTVNSGIAGNGASGRRCIEPLNGVGSEGTPIVVSDDHGSSALLWTIEGEQIRWTMASAGGAACLGTEVVSMRVVLTRCAMGDPSQRWTLTNRGIMVGMDGNCLSFPNAVGVDNNVESYVVLKTCSTYGQTWTIPW